MSRRNITNSAVFFYSLGRVVLGGMKVVVLYISMTRLNKTESAVFYYA